MNSAKAICARIGFAVLSLDAGVARTGIDGLDELLGGGIPRGRCILVIGGPGTGKTILGAQFIYNGVKKYGEKGIIVTLSLIHI